MSPPTNIPVPSLPSFNTIRTPSLNSHPQIAVDANNYRPSPRYAPSTSAYFDPESQSFHANQLNPDCIPNTDNLSQTATSYMDCVSSQQSNRSASTLSSSTYYNMSDPPPPNHQMRFVQSQLDDIKKDSMEKQALLQALQNATNELHKATTRISMLERENTLFHQRHPTQFTQNPTDPASAPPQQTSFYESTATPHPTPIPPLFESQHRSPPTNQTSISISEMLLLQQKISESQLTPKFPKFQGKSKAEFKTWYDQVLAVLSSPPWNTVFANITTKALKQDDDISPTLSSKLFSALRLSMSHNAEKLMMTKKESWGKGLLYLSILRDTYKESLHRADLLRKESEFSNLFIKQNETVDEFAARCIELRDQLNEHGIPTSPEGFKTRFIMGLGPMFTDIQQVQEEDLPSRWKTTDIQELVQAANSYKDEKMAIRDRNKLYKDMNIKNRPPPTQHQNNANKNHNNANRGNQNPRPPKQHPFELPLNQEDKQWIDKNLDRQERIEYAIKNGTFDPMQFAWEVRPNKCLWHNSTHPFTSCRIMNNLFLRYPQQKCYKVHKIDNWQPYKDQDFHPLEGIPPRPTSNKSTSNQPSARHTTLPNTDDVPVPTTDDPLNNLAETSDSFLNCNINHSNNAVNNYRIQCKSVTLNNTNDSTLSAKTNKPTTFIVDSAAYPHMMNDKDMFSSLKPWNNTITHVTLADGVSQAKIEGVGTIHIRTGKHTTQLQNVLFVPSLSDPLFSAKHHVSTPGNYIHIENENATIAFENFIIDIPIQNEIYLTVHKSEPPRTITANKTSLSNPNNVIPFTKMTTLAKMPIKSTPEAAGFDLFSTKAITLLPGQRLPIPTGIKMQLPKGTYGRIAPRSGLAIKQCIDVAAGVIDSDYRGEILPILVNNSSSTVSLPTHSKIAQLIVVHLNTMDLLEVAELNDTLRGDNKFGSTDAEPPQENTPKPLEQSTTSSFKWTKLNAPDSKITIKLPWNSYFSKGHLTKVTQGFQFTDLEHPQIIHILPAHQIKLMIQAKTLLLGHKHKIQTPNQQSTLDETPHLNVIHKPLPQIPNKTPISIDQLQKAFGFRNVSSILNEIKATSNHLSISTTDREPILDIGNTATVPKSPRNTFPLELPRQLGDIMHLDIIYGSGTAIQGIKYALFVVDRATRHKFIYPLKSLKTDVLPALEQLIKDIGKTPKILRSDFDHKLLGSKVQQFFKTKQTILESASPDRQNENGLCERNWRTILSMSRNWLASALLPSEFWWFAMRRATEVSNYLPLKVDNILTSPHQLMYKQKPDMRNLIPLFAVAYPEYPSKSSLDAQSCKAILVGKSKTTRAYEFYNPSTKNIITSSNFKLDERLTSGPAFGLPYDGGLHFNKYCQYNDSIRPPQFSPETEVFIKQPNNKYIQAHIIAIPKTDTNIYTIQYNDGSIHEIHETFISLNNPTISPSPNEPPLRNLPTWIKNNSKCTIFLNNMSRPSQGYLMQNQNKWQFRPGYKNNNSPIDLPDFQTNMYTLISTFQLFPGHQTFRKVHTARQSFQLGNIIARHVSATALTSTDAPTLLNHSKLNKIDKEIWDAAYSEEYTGLKNLPAWITITESEYTANKSKYGTLLPTMAISTVKYDEHGSPKRAKYRIVVLGNLDPHDWTKSDCFAPVMSLKELRLLTAIAIKHKCILQSGDFKQAFVQSILPTNETYVLKPPPGCKLTPKHTFWKLQRSLYGLKRAPRHWYVKATNILKEAGLEPCPNAPCLFKGCIIPGKPPLYLGLYVDDFIFFSQDKTVEKEFEKRIKANTNVDFMGNVTHFLGMRFQWRKDDTHLKVHLSQEAFSDTLIEQAGLSHFSASTKKTPYRSGYPVDMIEPDTTLSPSQRASIQAQYRSLVGSLLWLSQGTRPDLSTITNMLAQHQYNPNDRHIASAKHAIKYLKGTKTKGITFDSNTQSKLTSYVHFPIQSQTVQGISDANWGPQDQSKPNPTKPLPEIELFKTRSISGHVLTLMGPLHWTSKRQKITARSSCEAEIYATDECVKDIIHLRHVIQDLQLEKELLHPKIKIYNDNMACVMWSKNTTTKGLRHLQIRENAIRETKFIQIEHICGNINPADMFTKEDKDPDHFRRLRDTIVTEPFTPSPIQLQTPPEPPKNENKSCLRNNKMKLTKDSSTKNHPKVKFNLLNNDTRVIKIYSSDEYTDLNLTSADPHKSLNQNQSVR